MKPMPKDGIEVIIRSGYHRGCRGHLVPIPIGTDRVKVELDDCRHGMDQVAVRVENIQTPDGESITFEDHLALK